MGMAMGSTSTAGEGQAGVGIETDNPKVSHCYCCWWEIYGVD